MTILRVAGFDPSKSNWGIAIADIEVEQDKIHLLHVELCQTATEAKSMNVVKQHDDLRRSREMHQLINVVMEHWKPRMIFAEIPFYHAAMMASAVFNTGFVIGALGAFIDGPMIGVDPKDVKFTATGSRNADKKEMIGWAMNLHPEAPWKMRKLKGKMVPTNDNEHTADAVAVIHTGIKSQQYQQATAMFRSLRAA